MWRIAQPQFGKEVIDMRSALAEKRRASFQQVQLQEGCKLCGEGEDHRPCMLPTNGCLVVGKMKGRDTTFLVAAAALLVLAVSFQACASEGGDGTAYEAGQARRRQTPKDAARQGSITGLP